MLTKQSRRSARFDIRQSYSAREYQAWNIRTKQKIHRLVFVFSEARIVNEQEWINLILVCWRS